MESNKAYDLTHLREMLGGDVTAIKRMVKIFMENTPSMIQEMRTEFAAGNLEKVGNLAHKLKSSIDIFNIANLKTEIRDIENFAKEQSNPEELGLLIKKAYIQMEVVFQQISDDFQL